MVIDCISSVFVDSVWPSLLSSHFGCCHDWFSSPSLEMLPLPNLCKKESTSRHDTINLRTRLCCSIRWIVPDIDPSSIKGSSVMMMYCHNFQQKGKQVLYMQYLHIPTTNAQLVNFALMIKNMWTIPLFLLFWVNESQILWDVFVDLSTRSCLYHPMQNYVVVVL